ncbi:MAG TPA: hypothetical protein VHB99_08005, partial [Pirellulales bacterium]|nr:hypothetical protein [Pirellulales bacterium]
PRLAAATARQLCLIPDMALGNLLYPSSWWLQKSGKSLSRIYPESFDKIASRLIDILHLEPSLGRSAIVSSSKGRDWATDALNSPAGLIACALLEDSRLDPVGGNPQHSSNTLKQLERLLALSGNPRRHAITMISHRLGWCHRFFREWSDSHLLSILDSEDREDREALWAGVFWNPRISSVELFLRLKAGILALAKEAGALRTGHLQVLASLTLSGWFQRDEKNEERCISNAEFRDVLLHGGDDFRSHIVWQFERGLNDQKESTRKMWLLSAADVFRDVWPRQRVAKSAATSARLCELLLCNAESFSKLLDAVLPLLTKVAASEDFSWHLRRDTGDIIRSQAERLLQLLHVVLPEAASAWPYNIGNILNELGEANHELLSDSRLEDLKRKWNAR